MASRNNFLLLLVLLLALPSFAAEPELITHSRAAWQLLKDGKHKEGSRAFEALLSQGDDPVAKATDEMAHRWLTRLDREKVKTALRAAYAKKIEYPDTLAGINPAADRWGKPWTYQLTKPQFVTGIAKQTYRLESTALGAISDLTTALEIPYGSRITLKPVTVEGDVVTFEPTGRDQPVLLSVGTSFEGITFAAKTDTSLILSDGDHWLVLPLPKK